MSKAKKQGKQPSWVRGVPSYPEHRKLEALRGKNQTLGEFIEWLGEQGFEICTRDAESSRDNNLLPTTRRVEDWVCAFFNLDAKRLEDEKRAMLAEIRKDGR